MKKRLTVCAAVLLALLLCACGAADTRELPATTPEPTPVPTPTPTPAPTEAAVMADWTAEDILALGEMPSLVHIDATSSREYEAIAKLQELLPDCRIDWTIHLGAQEVDPNAESFTAETLDGLEAALPYMPSLKNIDLLSCEVTTDDIDRYMALRPDVDYLWWVKFGRWVVRSDIQIFSSMRTTDNHYYTNEELYPLLHYCTKLRALDLGHNALTDLTDIGKMTDLQVLIIADNEKLTDLSPLKNLDKLYYLEMFLCINITDFSGLDGMVSMEDMNCRYCRYLTDPSFLANMPKLRMLYCANTGIGLREVYPYRHEGCAYEVASESFESVYHGWRDTKRNIAIRHWFHHFEDIEEFVSWDNIILKDEALREGRDGTVKYSY